MSKPSDPAWGCFTDVSAARQNNLTKIHNARNQIYGENSKLKFCTSAQTMALGAQNCIFYNTKISREYLGELAIRQWNNPLMAERKMDFTMPGTHMPCNI